MTLPSALSIDCLTPECSTSRSMIRRLTRWRCRLKSPQAGQQQPMIGSSTSLQYSRASSSPTYDERPDDHVLAVVGDQARRHGLERAGEEEVQQQCLDEVVQVVPQRDLRRPDLGRDPVEDAPPKPRAERAWRGPGVEDVIHDVANRGVLDAVFPPALFAGLRDHPVLEILVAGVDVDRDQREVDRRPLPQVVERLQERPAVLAAREADHDAIAVFNEVEVGNRFRGLLGDAGFERAAVGH